jgi:excisionase family DNA binding protein
MAIKKATQPEATHQTEPPSEEMSNITRPLKNAANQYLSTIQTAKILNLSVGTVQKLVETNELQAWKTQGGHRRISVVSVESYKRYTLKQRGLLSRTANAPVRVLFLDSEEKTLMRIQKALKNTHLALDCLYVSSGLEAMLQLPVHQPDVIFSELNLKDIDGANLLRKLDQTKTIATMGMVAWSSLDHAAIDARGGLPERVVVVRKPVNTAWIEGYLSAVGNKRRIQK